MLGWLAHCTALLCSASRQAATQRALLLHSTHYTPASAVTDKPAISVLLPAATCYHLPQGTSPCHPSTTTSLASNPIIRPGPRPAASFSSVEHSRSQDQYTPHKTCRCTACTGCSRPPECLCTHEGNQLSRGPGLTPVSRPSCSSHCSSRLRMPLAGSCHACRTLQTLRSSSTGHASWPLQLSACSCLHCQLQLAPSSGSGH